MRVVSRTRPPEQLAATHAFACTAWHRCALEEVSEGGDLEETHPHEGARVGWVGRGYVSSVSTRAYDFVL